MKKRLKNLLAGFFPELTNYAFHYRNAVASKKVRLVIFGQGRTGSTLLENLLCSTGHFRENGELLGPSNLNIKFPFQYISGLSKRVKNENFIFHVKIYHLTRDRKNPVDPAVFLSKLSNDGWKIIYLKRQNKVKHALSNRVAQHRKNYHKYDEIKERFQIYIDPLSFEKEVEEREWYDQEERRVLAHLNYHEVIYENDLENPEFHQATINKILDFVGLEKKQVATKLKKVNTQSLKNLITNFDDFKNRLSEKGWLKYINS